MAGVVSQHFCWALCKEGSTGAHTAAIRLSFSGASQVHFSTAGNVVRDGHPDPRIEREPGTALD